MIAHKRPYTPGHGHCRRLQDLEEGLLGWPPILAAAFGFASIAPAMALMAWGTLRASVLPMYSSVAVFVAGPMLPLAAFLEGNVFEGGFVVAVVVFAAAWITIGLSLRRTDSSTDRSRISGNMGGSASERR